MSDFAAWYSNPANAAWYHQQAGTVAAPAPASTGNAFQDWYNASPANRDWYHRTTGSPAPTTTTTTTTPTRTPQPGAGENPTNGGTGGSGSSNSGQPTGSTSAVLVRDNTGKLWLVNFSGDGGGTRQAVDPTQQAKAVELFGEPITHWNQLPAAQRYNQIAKFGHGTNTVISLDVRLGFYDGGPADMDAIESEDDQEGADNMSAHAMIREVLEQYGLGGLSDWAWGMLQNNRSYAEIMLDLRNQPLFKERFKAIDIRRANGLNPVSPETIIEYENTARDLMRSSGLPGGFYDQPDDFAQLIGKGVSLQSVQDRVQQTWDRVVNAPPEVRDAWATIYGAKSDQALAAFIFDPDNSEVKLREMARTSVAGGAMRTFGLGLDATAAARVAGFDLEDSVVRSGFGQLAQLRAVFEETRGERNSKDLDAMREGVNAIFDAGEGQADIERRVLSRRSELGGGGGALLSNTGLSGAGTV